MTDERAEDRRGGYRLHLQAPVRINTEESGWIEGETTNIGSGGILVFTSKSLCQGAEIEYVVSLPQFRSIELRCKGKVLRSKTIQDGVVEAALTITRCFTVEGTE
jgi:hypothetical protein